VNKGDSFPSFFIAYVQDYLRVDTYSTVDLVYVCIKLRHAMDGRRRLTLQGGIVPDLGHFCLLLPL
jgi:hypothetical protein